MSPERRRGKQRDEMRAAILKIALKLYAGHGSEGVTMQEIGDQLGIAPSAIYHYFRNKDEIFLTLAEEGVERMARCLESRSTGSLDALRDRFWLYYQFTRKYPHYFALMYVDHSVPRVNLRLPRFRKLRALIDESQRLVQRCVDAGVFPPDTSVSHVLDILTAVIQGSAFVQYARPPVSAKEFDLRAATIFNMTLGAIRNGMLSRTNMAAVQEFPTTTPLAASAIEPVDTPPHAAASKP
jgi:AcrR family transcriptional regulator